MPGACRTLVVDSEKRLQRGHFSPDSPPHGCSMGQEFGDKWAAAVASQPTIPKSDRLLTSPFTTWVEPADLGFNSAHFITYGNVCENLHGHNFHTRVIAHGDDSGEGYVLDFVALTRLARDICQTLSDRVILPGNSPVVRLEQQDGLIKVESFGKRYWLESSGCVVLPIANATAELIAGHIGERLSEALRRENLASGVHLLEVGVEEADRQWGISRHRMS